MKALVWTDTQRVELQERDVPDYTGKILIRVAYAGICGSDVSVYLGKHPRAKPPLVMGHEFSGTVAAIGEGVETDLQIGDAVVVNPLISCGWCRACLKGNSHVCRSLRLYGTDVDGGMAEFAAVPASCVYKVPAGCSLKLAAVVEPVAVVVHGLRMLKKDFFASACVIGLGPMGLLTALLLKDSGVRQLFTIEANPKRADYGRRLGLTVIEPGKEDPVESVLAQTQGEGVDVLVEASGSGSVSRTMTELTAVRGEILLLSVFKDAAMVDLRTVNFREQSLIGTRVYTRLDFLDAITYVEQNGQKIEAVISHTCAPEEGQSVFQRMIGGNTDMMKVLFQF